MPCEHNKHYNKKKLKFNIASLAIYLSFYCRFSFIIQWPASKILRESLFSATDLFSELTQQHKETSNGTEEQSRQTNDVFSNLWITKVNIINM